jgi:hypothetical protein
MHFTVQLSQGKESISKVTPLLSHKNTEKKKKGKYRENLYGNFTTTGLIQT